MTVSNPSWTRNRALKRLPDFCRFFHLNDAPFQTAPNPAYAFATPSALDGAGRMRDVVNARTGLGLISGPIGVGKSTLANSLQNDLATRGGRTILFPSVPGNQRQSEASILRDIATQLNLPKRPGNSTDAYFADLFRFVSEIDENGFTTTILIDDAQQLNRTGVKAIKTLLSIQSQESQLIQILLFGQNPEMIATLTADPALHTRLAAHRELDPFTLQEVAEMLAHRMKVAGRTAPLFTPSAIETITQLSLGNPRIICRLAHGACERAFTRKNKMVDTEDVEATNLLHGTTL